MSDELHEDDVLMERFVLRRCLRGGTLSQLWLAQDWENESDLLLQVHRSEADAALAQIKSLVLRHRPVEHPHVARILDVHEAPGQLLVPLDVEEGELLADVLERTGPVPYRRLLESCRPLVEAVRQVHEHGGEHGQLEAHHLLVVQGERWMLLPPEASGPTRSDLEQLGHLLAAALTGGRPPEGGRELNDVAERLHEGRTVPALLNQLVSDLTTSDRSRRPAGMKAVLDRLDQLEAYLEPASAASAPQEPRATPGPQPRARARPARSGLAPWLRWLAAPSVVLIGAALFHPAVRDLLERTVPVRSPTGPQPAADPSAGPAAPDGTGAVAGDAAEGSGGPAPAKDGRPADADARGGDEPAVDPRIAAELAAARERERTAADEALSRFLAVRRQADDIGVSLWGDERYPGAVEQAQAADRAFLEERYVDAAAQYDEASAAFQALIGSSEQVLERLLRDGAEAVVAGDAVRATESFRAALLIDPQNERATIGLQRAGTLDELNRLLASGSAHEEAGNLAFAHVDYAAAAELDPRSEEAATAFRRVKARLADEEFQAMMSRGLDAYHRGDLDEARGRLLEAQQFRPGSTEVAGALEMVEQARLRRELLRLNDEALALEQQEQWQEAWNTYRQVLAIDPAMQFAVEGKARCEDVIRLEKRTSHYLDNPDLLTRRDTREDAIKLVHELRDRPDKGPRLQQAYDRLAEQVRLANTPRRVLLRSDEQTEVAVYRVGRYGKFKTVELELLPGEYTIIGQRRGYKDVRLTLRLGLDDMEATLEVVCTERI